MRLRLLFVLLLAAIGGVVLACTTAGDAKPPPCKPSRPCGTTSTPSTTTSPPTTSTEEPPPTTTAPPPTPPAVWSADHETGDASQWTQPGGISTAWDDAGCIEHAVVADGHARSGIYSMKMTIDETAGIDKAGCRQAQTREIQTGGTYIYETSYFLPQPVLTTANHWNVCQFKSKEAGASGSDPIWTIDFQGDPLRPVLAWKGGQHGLAGPMQGDSTVPGQIDYPQLTPTLVPIGQWTTLRVYLDQSAGFDGRITVWHDGELIYDLAGVRTEYPSLDARWSVNNYSNGLTVNPYTLYIDDAAITAPG